MTFIIKKHFFPNCGALFRDVYDRMGLFGESYNDEDFDTIYIKIRTVEAAHVFLITINKIL